MDSEWDLLEGTSLVITDIGVLSKKEKAPPDYEVIENTNDGKKADFPEGKFSTSKRYICFSRKMPSPQRGRAVLTDLKVLSANDSPPPSFLPLTHTLDDHSKTFHSKMLLASFSGLDQASEAISDIVILSAAKKEDVPKGFKRLPEINGYSLCFKMGKVSKKETKPAATQPKPVAESTYDINRQDTIMIPKKVKTPVDGLKFELTGQCNRQEYLVQFALGDLQLLSLQDVEDKFDCDWTEWKSLANQTN